MRPACDVLVVDDEPVVSDAVRLVLGQDGLTVTAVGDAESALAHPDLTRCRLVVCDLMLPGRSGLEALTAMHACRPDLPIIMTTGYATPAQEQAVMAAGATAFLPKPFDESELLSLVRDVLSRAVSAPEERSP
jgi:DNA-binding NtrC family response regulator